jgi:hypothetical protein
MSWEGKFAGFGLWNDYAGKGSACCEDLWVRVTISYVIRDWLYACEAEKRHRLHMRDGTFNSGESIFVMISFHSFVYLYLSQPTPNLFQTQPRLQLFLV